MPYIITTTSGERYGDGYPGTTFSPLVTRRAVATIQEARQAVFVIAEDALGIGRDIATQVEACRAVHETDPVSLPLPDGSVIEVACVDWRSMLPTAAKRWPSLRFATNPADDEQARIIDAYNAAQA